MAAAAEAAYNADGQMFSKALDEKDGRSIRTCVFSGFTLQPFADCVVKNSYEVFW